MNRLQLCVLLVSGLFASVLAQSTPNKAPTGDEQFSVRPVVNPPTSHSTKEAAIASLGGKVPPNLEILKYSERRTSGDPLTGWYVVEKAPIITGSDLQDVRAKPAMFEDRYQLAIKLNPKASEKLREWTKANVGNYLAIVLDGVVVSVSVVRDELKSRDVIIDLNITKEEAENLSVRLRRG
jgi:preprotein translocase subunit SecD